MKKKKNSNPKKIKYIISKLSENYLYNNIKQNIIIKL